MLSVTAFSATPNWYQRTLQFRQIRELRFHSEQREFLCYRKLNTSNIWERGVVGKGKAPWTTKVSAVIVLQLCHTPRFGELGSVQKKEAESEWGDAKQTSVRVPICWCSDVALC